MGDSGLDTAFAKGEIAFSAAIDDRLKQLGVQLQKISDARKPEAIIDDPAMEPIRKMAAEILINIGQ